MNFADLWMDLKSRVYLSRLAGRVLQGYRPVNAGHRQARSALPLGRTASSYPARKGHRRQGEGRPCTSIMGFRRAASQAARYTAHDGAGMVSRRPSSRARDRRFCGRAGAVSEVLSIPSISKTDFQACITATKQATCSRFVLRTRPRTLTNSCRPSAGRLLRISLTR